MVCERLLADERGVGTGLYLASLVTVLVTGVCFDSADEWLGEGGGGSFDFGDVDLFAEPLGLGRGDTGIRGSVECFSNLCMFLIV